MPEKSKSILIIAGESSGDYHGANLVKAMKTLDPSLSFWGLGGAKMEMAGVELVKNIQELSVLGVTDVLKKIKPIISTFRLLKKELLARGADTVLLVDYPGFNLRFAQMAKKRGFKVVYYITPKVWAWGGRRINKLRNSIDKALVIFSFEEEIFRRAGIPVSFVGNPLLDGIKTAATKSEARQLLRLNGEKETIVLLPGSREGEIRRILPAIMEAAQILSHNQPSRQFILPLADSIAEADIMRLIAGQGIAVKVVSGETHNAIKAADMAIATSGTVTLETAIIGVPMVIVYKTSLTTYLIAKLLARTSFIGLPNIILGKAVVCELLQGLATGERIATEVESLGSRREEFAQAFASIREMLGAGNAVERVAQEIFAMLRNR
ncbi:MAG: lipid-A-disaccharide synthase [Deltaproteobacteria bacterium]|nr:lipid-A-disaccharide synthase [Deltaproteobacteria bacterium]